MKYEVIRKFYDMKDPEKTIYKKGDVYPRKGFKLSQARLDELASTKNRIGKKLIKEVKDDERKPRKTNKGNKSRTTNTSTVSK